MIYFKGTPVDVPPPVQEWISDESGGVPFVPLRKEPNSPSPYLMKPTPEQMTAVKTALCSIVEEPASEFELPSHTEFRSAVLDEALQRFFSENPEALNLEEFVELLCRHLS